MINKFTNVVDNVCLWDGNTETWQPPSEYLMLIQSTTPDLIWNPVREIDPKTGKSIIVDWVLVEEIGSGDIGFTWDGSILTTNQPKPNV